MNAPGAVLGTMRRAVHGRAVVTVLVAILDPFRHAAVHVAETKAVRRERTDLGGTLAIEVCLGRGDDVAEGVFRRRSRAGGIFPLGFGQQTIGARSRKAELAVEPRQKLVARLDP